MESNPLLVRSDFLESLDNSLDRLKAYYLYSMLAEPASVKMHQKKIKNLLKAEIRNNLSEHELSGKPVRGKHSQVINVPTAVCVYLIALTGLCIIADGCSVVSQRSCGYCTDAHLRPLMCVHACEHAV